MNAFRPLLALLAVPAMVISAYAEQTPGALSGYLPTGGNLLQGAAVRVAMDPSIVPFNQSIANKFNALPEEKRAEIAAGMDSIVAMEYRPELFESREQYDAYMESWRKARLIPSGVVALGLMATDTQGMWSVLSATVDNSGKTLPLTISALKYNADKNVWISNNGELTAKPYSISDRCVLGAQEGTEWSLQKEDSLTRLNEAVRVTRTTDGQCIYVFYSFAETSRISGAAIAQGGYVLRFPIVSQSAGLSTPGQK